MVGDDPERTLFTDPCRRRSLGIQTLLTPMNPDNKKFLEDNEHTWITLRDAGYMMGLDGATRSAMARIICEEFRPGYATDMWCGPCVADMVTLLYRHYNEWKEKNSTPVIDPLHTRKAEMIADLLVEVGPPADLYKVPASIQPVKASFPKHPNKNRR